MRWPLLRPVLVLLLALPAQAARDVSPLEPLLELQVIGREVIAIDSEGGGQRSLRLERGESFLYQRSQGRVGAVVTDRRILAVATRSGTWQEARYRSGEPPPADVTLGDRVVLALMPTRAVGFDGNSRNLIEAPLGPRETVLETAVGANVALVVTGRRALGLSSDRGGFFEVRLRLGERLESVSALANHATVQTSQRLLIFRGPAASWEERRLPVR